MKDPLRHVDGPPTSVETLLRLCLPPYERDPIVGDLLEEYREVVFPLRGRRRADLWYIRQALGLAAWGLTCTRPKTERSDEMRVNSAPASTWWCAAGTISLLALFSPFVFGRFGPPIAFPVALGGAVLLSVLATPVLTSQPAWGVLARVGLLWGIGLAVVVASRMVLDALAPVDPLERFLAQAADGYSEWNYPRRWVFGLAVAVILLAAGFTGARTHGDVRAGTLTALAASVIGGVLAVLVAVIGRAVLGPLGFFFDIEGLLPLSMAGAVLGTVGAMIGRGVRPHRAAAMPTPSV